MANCGASVVNLNRHLRVATEAHRAVDIEQYLRKRGEGTVKVARTYGGKKSCPLCHVGTVRLDLHLQRIHKLKKGSRRYMSNLVAATMTEDQDSQSEYDRCLAEYGYVWFYRQNMWEGFGNMDAHRGKLLGNP